MYNSSRLDQSRIEKKLIDVKKINRIHCSENYFKLSRALIWCSAYKCMRVIPGKICAIRAFVSNAGDGSGSTLDETGIQVCVTRVYCVRMDRQVYMQTEKPRRLGFIYYNWRTYISRAYH